MRFNFRPIFASRAGASATLFALAAPTMLGGVGFGTDSALIRVTQSQLQTAADAAALAGARSGTGDSVAPAVALAAANMPAAQFGTVLAASDVVTGTWAANSRTFTAGGAAPNAVQVTTRQAAANGNAHKLVFGRFVGLDTLDIAARAIAVGDSVSNTITTTSNCTKKTDLSLVYDGKPTRTNIVTYGEGVPTTYFESADHYPIIRIDNGYDGQAVITFTAYGKGNFTFTAPARGQYAVEVRLASIRNNTPTVPYSVTFNGLKSVPAPPSIGSSSTSVWTNSLRTLPVLPGKALCTDGTVAVTTETVRTIKGRLVS